MGITYATTAFVQGDPFPVLIRKMAQKLGVTVDVGDNVYKVMWKVLADQSWSLGTQQSFVNVANQNVVYVTTPFQGDTLNVLFLKFAQRTGYVIITRNGIGGVQATSVMREILDPNNVPGGGGSPGGTFTITYVNDYGTITGTNPQTITGTGTPVTANIDASMSVTFTQWDDGVTDNPRTDTPSADATVSVEVSLDAFNGSSEDSTSDKTIGEEIDDVLTEGTAGWWGPWVTYYEAYMLVEDSFDLKTLSSSLEGQAAEYDVSGLGVTWSCYAPLRTEIVGDDFEDKVVTSNLNGQDDRYGNTWIVV